MKLRYSVITIGICLVLMFATLPLVTGCGATTTTATATATVTTTIQPIILRVPTTAPPPPSMGLTLTQSEIGKLIEAKTNGRVKLEIYWSESLVKGTETINALQTGVADLAYLRSFAEPGKVPLCTSSELPGISQDNWSLLWGYWDLMNQPEISGELAKYNLKQICSILIAQQNLISRTPIRTIDDLKGKKVAASGVSAEIVKGLGGVPLAMSPAEQYEGLLRGTVDAICAPPDAVQSFKFYEGGKYYTKVQISPRMHPVVMNKDTWNKLPADIQKIFTDMVPELHAVAYDTIMNQTAGAAWKAMADAGVEIITFSAADEAKAQQVRAAYADKWAADMEAKGLPGNKVLNDYKTFVAKYEKTSPYINK